MLLLALPAWSTDVYRWVDEQGQQHYSDQWRPGAERIRIQTTPTYSPRPLERPAATGAEPARKAQRYESLVIVSPAQEEVLWNIEGQLRVSLRTEPPLLPEHDLRLYLDGQLREIPEGSTEVVLNDVFRGAHTLRAEVTDATGAVLIESQPVTFFVRQTSILNPSRPPTP